MKQKKSSLPFSKSARAVAAMFADGDAASDSSIQGAVDELGRLLSRYAPAAWSAGAFSAALDYAGILVAGRPLHSLDEAGRRKVLRALERIPLSRNPLWLSSLLYKTPWLFQDETLARAGSRYGLDVPGKAEPARWRSQIQHAADTEEDVEMEAEVIVIGSGAGGAAAAYELASRGIAVAMVEAGDYYHRPDFDGEYLKAIQKIYRFYPAVGNGVVSILAGQSVGGTTTINSGTCFRTPDSVLQNWVDAGLREFTPENMASYFTAVEEMIGVEEGSPAVVGPLFDYVRKGAESLGLRDVHRLQRNATGCDGQALCAFGCPTAAKRSTDVSYVPAALHAGAFLYAGFKVDALLRDGSRVEGVTATGRRQDGTPVRLRIKAPEVVLAMGTVQTPLFLKEQGVSNPHLGKHLTIHPTGLVGGLFDGVDFKNDQTIPQGVGIGDLASEGIRFEGATPPLGVYGAGIRMNGPAFRELIDAYPRTAFMGFMVSDTSEGTVRRSIRGMPLITYSVNREDVRRYVRGMATVARLMFRAGAHAVNLYTFHGETLLRSEAEVDRFERRRWRARDFSMSAYHPLGTARLAPTPAEGVCDPDHRVFGMEGLSVMDGSVVPSSLGVNPQVTIMAMASRAAVKLADRLSQPSRHGMQAV